MTLRGFLFLLAAAVVASIGANWFIVPYTTPGAERTVWFAVIVGATMYVAGLFAEKRGWVSGKLDLSKRGAQKDAAGKDTNGDGQ